MLCCYCSTTEGEPEMRTKQPIPLHWCLHKTERTSCPFTLAGYQKNRLLCVKVTTVIVTTHEYWTQKADHSV